MNTRKLVIGAALAAIAMLSACSSERDVPDVAAANRVAAAPTTSQSAPTTTAKPTTSTTPPATSSTTSSPATRSTTSKAKQMAAKGAPCSAAARACVKLSTKQAWLLDDGAVTYGPVPITSGKAGYRTPPGRFRVQWKDINHKSSQFNNAPMPYSVFFNGGIAFHQGSLRVQSHGCIHLSSAAAKAFYNLPVGAVVEVVR